VVEQRRGDRRRQSDGSHVCSETPAAGDPRADRVRLPLLKGLTIIVNSQYNGWRMEDVWLDR